MANSHSIWDFSSMKTWFFERLSTIKYNFRNFMNIITKKITFFCLQSPLSRVCVYLFLLSYCKEQFWSFIEVYNNVNVLWRNQVKLKVCFVSRCGGGGGIEKILPTDRAVPTLFKQIQRKCFFDPDIEFFVVTSVKKIFSWPLWSKKRSRWRA
jgi:hypothetical protein